MILFVAGAVSQWKAPGLREPWRDRTFRQAEGMPRCVGPVSVSVTPVVRDRRGVVECGSTWPLVDAMLDGLVSAGVLAGRREDAVCRVVFEACRVGGEEGIELAIGD